MAGDSTLEKVNKINVFIIKFILISVIFIGAITSFFWGLFYSNYFANLAFTIPLRNWYQGTYWKIEGMFLKPQRFYPPFDPVYEFQVQEVTSDTYVYSFWGTFTKFDIEKGIIYLRDKQGRLYGFEIGQDWPLLDNGTVNPTDFINIPSTKKFDQSSINVDDKAYTTSSKITILWDDKRTLIKIFDDFSKNSNIPLNQNSVKLFSLTKFN